MAGVWSGLPVHEKGFNCDDLVFCFMGCWVWYIYNWIMVGYILDWYMIYWLEFNLGIDYNNTLIKDTQFSARLVLLSQAWEIEKRGCFVLTFVAWVTVLPFGVFFHAAPSSCELVWVAFKPPLSVILKGSTLLSFLCLYFHCCWSIVYFDRAL